MSKPANDGNKLKIKDTPQETKGKKVKRVVHQKVISKKPYIEFLTAFISVPLSITWLFLNLNNIKNVTAGPTPSPSVSPVVTIIKEKEAVTTSSTSVKGLNTTNPTTVVKVVEKEACKEGLGTVKIVSPAEGEVVTGDPVTFTIDYDNSTYCNAAWSYRVNGGEWSGYSDTSLGVYNLPEGPVTFELHVKSVVNDDATTLVRKFIYKSSSSAASSSAR